MTIKDLLLLLDAQPAAEARVEATMALADRFGARVMALHLVPEPYMPGIVGHHMPEEVLKEHVAHATAEAHDLLAAVRAAADRRGVALELVTEVAAWDRLPGLLARHARLVDLVLLGRPDRAAGGADEVRLAEAAFLDSGQPALLLPPPPEAGNPPTLPPWRVLVAWDGSRAAARAMRDALPLLKVADSTVVVIVEGRDTEGWLGVSAGVEVAARLARHGVQATAKVVPSGGAGTAATLLAQAQEEGADLLVMGGYGHSRFREMILGGVTRHLLDHADLPLLVSH